ncbi:HesA/MoeB/ThiF family protein [Donghicola mangrovi]|uniref:HesA/MoeB/ThiF family protein n=1 Tax=Donghicola mangrovi TaxID=2729614 RepID=A0A850QB73_9RHOB|nr:HesA/MoeB/ThiF family protein [Donghicola mangrovi]NVO24080.1 HesA/MoeB/ThiF family protein [Donghicola mangrovi]
MAGRNGAPMSRYARQMILPEVGADGQARLTQAHVLVVGCGGLGSAVIPALAGAGVGRLTLMDHDLIDLSNLHRQTIYRTQDVGLPKVDCAARYARALNPDVQVDAVRLRLDARTAPAAVQGIDLVIDAADSFAVSYILSDLCLEMGLPLISASVLGWGGYVGGFCGGAPSLRAVFPDLPDNGATCATAGVMGPVVGMIGAMQAQMALAVLLGHRPSPLGQMMQVDMASYRVSTFGFDTAPEPEDALLFIHPDQLSAEDRVLDLRSETEAPAMPCDWAQRIAPEGLSAVNINGQRIVLTCRSGLRAWQAARVLRERGAHSLAILAMGD